MKRREFITLLGGAAAWPLAARAGQEKRPRVGSIQTFPNENIEAFSQGLREAGYVDGHRGVLDRIDEFASELVARITPQRAALSPRSAAPWCAGASAATTRAL